MERLNAIPATWVALLLAIIAASVYANSLASGFAFDDFAVIANNTALHDIRNIGSLAVSPYWPDLPPAHALYRPVTIAAFALDWQIWSGGAAGFHAGNAIAHAAVTVLAFMLLLRLGAALGAAAIGGAIFAVHPVHTEAVSNIVGRAEVLAAGFILVACLIFLDRRLAPALRIGGISLCYLLALGSKESAVMLPGLLILLGWLHPERPESLFRQVSREWKLLAILTIALVLYLALRYSVLGVLGGALPAASLRDVSTADRIATAIRIWPEYLRLLLFPRDLIADYSPAVIMPTDWRDVRVWIALPLGVAAMAAAFLLRRRNAWGALALLWFAMAMLPVANLLFPVGVILAERTLYLPSLAVSLAIPAFVPAFRALTGTGQKFMLGVAAALVLAGAIRTWTRNPAWRSTDIVFETLARENPESYRGIWYTAATEMERGNVALALKLYGQAFELMPNEQQLGSTYAFELLSHGYAAGAERVVRQIFNSGYLFNHQVLIESLIRLGKYEEAEGELKIARGYFSRDSVLEKLEVLLLERRAAATDTVRGRGGGASLE